MTDVVTPSNIMSAPLASLSPEQATERREALLADENFKARIAAKDVTAFNEAAELWKIARGITESPPPPETPNDVMSQAYQRAVESLEVHAQALDKHFDLTPRQQFEILTQRPVYEHEKKYAANELAKKTRDAGFMERWRNGDRVARTEMYLLNAIKVAPLSQSEEETAAWDRDNPFVGWNHA